MENTNIQWVPGMKTVENDLSPPVRVLWIGVLDLEKWKSLSFSWRCQTREFVGNEVIIYADDEGYSFWRLLENWTNMTPDEGDLATRLLMKGMN